MTNTHRPRSSLAVWLVVGVVLLPALYVLSVGPVWWLMAHDYLRLGSDFVYWPLYAIMEACPPIRHLLNWYISLWVPLVP